MAPIKSYLVLLMATMTAVVSMPAEPSFDGEILCRVSTENVPAHFQAKALRRFSELIAERSDGALRVEFYDSGRMYRDADAVGAVARGELEIALPGIWQLDKLAPDTAALMLPMMYAKPREVARAIVDGPVGTALSRDLEKAMGAVVLGPWLDLGFGHVFSTKLPIRSVADIRGRRIRVAGGKGNDERIKALGGIPVSIPLLDLSAYLERGLIDGILSTYETVDSSGLYSRGIRSVLEDMQYYPFYVPVAGAAFWARLNPAQRSMLMDAWAEVVAVAREDAVRAQDSAKRRLVERGLKVYKPTSAESTRTLALLLSLEQEISGRLHISKEMLDLLRRELERVSER